MFVMQTLFCTITFLSEKIGLNNVITQYGDQLLCSKNGIIIGDNHSVSLANIVQYIV